MNESYEFLLENVLFDWKYYLVSTSELNEQNIFKKSDVLGYFKIKNESIYKIITSKNKEDALKLLDVKQRSNMLFRYICCSYLNLIRLIKLPNVPKNSKYEAVFIECRCFPHIEFLIRNAIYKLGEEWSHTIVCGGTNYSYVLNIVNKISFNIRVIKINSNNLSVTEYNKLLTSLNFWETLKGEKILIHQEDSLIFENNIMDFVKWDYIGAPLPLGSDDTPNSVGNGGLSLRTRDIMIEVINKISPTKTKYNSSTIEYMKVNKLNYPPEDVYFSKNMQELNIGKVADWNTASYFSSESHYNSNSFGGHKFWISNSSWIQHISNSIFFKTYESKSDVGEYIKYKKKVLPNQVNINMSNLYKHYNHFDIDFIFYKTLNNLNMLSAKSIDELCYHFNNFGIYGLIYHPKQLINLYPNIKIYSFYDKLIIKDEEHFYEGSIFVNKKVYEKTFDDVKDMTLSKISSNNFTNETSSLLLLLVFMGNIEIGKELLEKIIKYKQIQKFHIAFCFNSSKVINYFSDEIQNNFDNYVMYKSNEYGTDITSSLLMYYDISLKCKFKYIIKMHTKTIRPQFDELVDFLLSDTLENLLRLKNPLCNCIGNEKHYVTIHYEKDVKYDFFNKILIDKYKHEFDKEKHLFVAGTIFLSESVVLDNVVNFVKKNNHHSFLLNNLYENNSVNMDNSPIHFLERLFGIINLDYTDVSL